MTAAPPVPGNLDDYVALLTELAGLGYRACGFLDAEPDRPDLILRHDIDMSVDCAVAMGEAEAAQGIAASYFVLLRSELYNAWSPASRDGLQQLGALGHEIGLHFDAALYPGEIAALDRACADECAQLEAILGQPVRLVSFHRPAPALRGLDRPIGSRRHAYEPRFFEAIGYCSDSNGGWYHGPPLAHDAVRARRALQLLTHPVWWVAPGATAAERLDRILTERVDALDRALAENCRAHETGWRERQVGR
ncbi:MAG: hypothetical protein R3F55_07880 [Alphaproteobacteria bacterium]